MTTIKTLVRNRRIDIPAPSDIPDGTEVTLTIAESDDAAPLPPAEIARVLAAMQQFDAWCIPADIAADLDNWERQIRNRHPEEATSIFAAPTVRPIPALAGGLGNAVAQES